MRVYKLKFMSNNPLRICQQEALNAFDKNFYEDANKRGILSMCCGSGKSYTIYNIIKKCIIEKKELFFVIATSRIHLISQLLRDFIGWSNNDKLTIKIRVHGGNNDLDKSYKTKVIPKEFLSEVISNVSDDEPLLIITTYNSSKNIIDKIKELHKKKKIDIKDENSDNDEIQRMYFPDLILFDEAHNTTGENKEMYQCLLKTDELFESAKYLFLTATPVQLLLKNKDAIYQNEETVYTMDNTEIYGNIIYSYTFNDGFKDKILVPFDTIYYRQIDGIPEEIKNELKNKSREYKQDIYFKQISKFLIESIAKQKLKHTLVYLQNQEKVKLVKKILDEMIKEKILSHEMYTVISEMKKNEREKNLTNFRSPSKNSKILFSVGIFDEGVDEPCIDSVMFAEERNTESRIVQNIGRCLRTYKYIDKKGAEHVKKKSYVIIPNIIYDCESQFDNNASNIQSSYSSCYKKIRNVISIIKKDTHNHFYKKYVSGDKCDISDEEEKDKIDNCEKIVHKKTSRTKLHDKENLEQVIDINKYYAQKCTSNDIKNMSLNDLKQKINGHNIKTIVSYVKFANELNNWPYLYLHKEFSDDWISWNHFLNDRVSTYEESKNFIKNLPIKMKSSLEWAKYYNDCINNEILNKRNPNMSDTIFNDMISIPNRPKEYYKGDWISWDDFLGHETIQQIGVVGHNPTIGTFADKNLNILVNTDYEKIHKLKRNRYNTIELEIDMNIIKEYLDNMFGINCILQLKVLVNKNGGFDKCVIYGRRDTDLSTHEPIIIFPTERKYEFDYRIASTYRFGILDINRNKSQFFQNPQIINLLKDILNKCKEYVQKNKDN